MLKILLAVLLWGYFFGDKHPTLFISLLFMVIAAECVFTTVAVFDKIETIKKLKSRVKKLQNKLKT